VDTCQHCNYSEATHVLDWKYPDESYSLAAGLCHACAEQVRLRNRRGLLVIWEDVPMDEFLYRAVRP